MTELVIVADDLTGAADSVAPLARRGRTSVVLDAEAQWPPDDVLALDTDSRHCQTGVGADRVAAVTRRAHRLGAQIVKKVDSTLRGNIVAELRALAGVLADEGERTLLVVAPAFPALSRTTRGGVVHVEGRPLAAHGSDGDVVALLERGGLRTGWLDTRAEERALAALFDEAHRAGRDAVVVDAVTDVHLATVVAAAHLATVSVVLVGSGGLTRPLAGVAGRGGTRDTAPVTAGTGGATLVVVGSYAEASRLQRNRLVDAGARPVTLGDDPERTAKDLRAALSSGLAVLSSDPEAPVVRNDAPRVARALASTVAAVLGDVDTLVATGGETARAVLTAAGVSRLVVTAELEPGIVLGRVPELDLDVVTKAGSFGDADALLRCVRPQLSTTVPQGGTTP
ncbi:MAG: D-threonate/D-erythronate kinase [Nocardioidaceae bacterium]|jgi:uncharacterized protein YgbK (DUF1537 family)|nr:D-threonate/D-erythronate kinase [Nocardioidaceae bacterium]